MLFVQWIFGVQTFLETKLEEYNQGHGLINHYIFTDSDMVVVDDLGQIFHSHPSFHLALTFRNNKEQPLNSGFIAVRGTPTGILRCIIVFLFPLLYISSKVSSCVFLLFLSCCSLWLRKLLEGKVWNLIFSVGYQETWNSKISKWLHELAAQTCAAILLC